jgi:hypothetical protein
MAPMSPASIKKCASVCGRQGEGCLIGALTSLDGLVVPAPCRLPIWA